MKIRKISVTAITAIAAIALSATTAMAASPSYTYSASNALGSAKGTISVNVAKQQICYTIKSSTVKNLKSIQLWAAGQKTMNLNAAKVGATTPTCVKLSDPEAPTDVTGSVTTAYVKFTTTSGKTLKAYLKK